MMRVLADTLQARGIRSHLLAPSAGWLLPAAQTAGHGTTVLPSRRGPDIRELLDLVRALRAVRPDVIHAHMFVMAVYGAIAARILGIPCVITLHEPPGVTEARRRQMAMRLALSPRRSLLQPSRAAARSSSRSRRWVRRSSAPVGSATAAASSCRRCMCWGC